jgi:hypothetical protein
MHGFGDRPHVLAGVMPVDDLGVLAPNSVATWSQIHLAPSPSTTTALPAYRPMDPSSRRPAPRVARLRRPGGERRRVPFPRGQVARLSQMAILPAANQTQLDLMPITLDWRATQISIAIADHHPICLDHQRPRRWVMLVARWLMGLLDFIHNPPLVAPQFGADLLRVRPQRFTANLHAGQVGQESSCLARGGNCTERRLPARQTVNWSAGTAPDPAPGQADSSDGRSASSGATSA